MPSTIGKTRTKTKKHLQGSPQGLVIMGLQQIFLQRVADQLQELAGDRIDFRTLSLNELDETPPTAADTVMIFSPRLKAIVERIYPQIHHYILARRESLLFNMRDLLTLPPDRRVLVVSDMKTNTEETTREIQGLGLGHEYLPWRPDERPPEGIDLVVTPGERQLVPPEIGPVPIIDIGPRVVSLATIYTLFDHFRLEYDAADLAQQYIRVMLLLPETWPQAGAESYRKPYWLGVRRDTSAELTFADIIQHSTSMAALCRDGARMAATHAPVHIYGRTGTGKGCVAQAIHNASPNAEGPFVSINCAARTPETLERELFGWEGDAAAYPSLFETAEGGTLCIEEISRLSTNLQARLLQAVDEGKVVRTDGIGVVDIHVRLITTASQRLDRRVPDGFDPELFLMITQHFCRVPPLVERMADLEPLIADYLARQLRKPHLEVPAETITLLKAHSWEGNVQELYNVLQHAACMTDDTITPQDLPYCIPKALGERPSGIERAADRATAASEEAPSFAATTADIVAHGFIEEVREILTLYQAGKAKNLAFGRETIRGRLQEGGISLSKQQLRLKLERLDKLGLLIVRPGRGGTTISDKGERYLAHLQEERFFE